MLHPYCLVMQNPFMSSSRCYFLWYYKSAFLDQASRWFSKRKSSLHFVFLPKGALMTTLVIVILFANMVQFGITVNLSMCFRRLTTQLYLLGKKSLFWFVLIVQLITSYQVGILGNAADFNEADTVDGTSYDNMDRRRMMIAFDMRYDMHA